MLANLPYSIGVYCFGLLTSGGLTVTLLLSGGNVPVRQAEPETVFVFVLFLPSIDLIQLIQFRYFWRTFSMPGTAGAQHIISIIPSFGKYFSLASHIHPHRPFSLLHSYAKFTHS